MRKILLFLILLSFIFIVKPAYASTELLNAPWYLTGNNGAAEAKQNIAINSLVDMTQITITYNLHGLCAKGTNASAIIFEQPTGTWHYISLSNYGQNCLDGIQTVTIPLSDFPGLNTNLPIGQNFHTRFWYNTPFKVDILSATLSTKNIWDIRAVDVMKLSKDVVCNQPSQDIINTMVQRAYDLGVNYIAISTSYDNPPCGDAMALTRKWVTAIRAKGIHVWHRHMGNSFEGISGVAKKYNDDYLQLISNYIINNPDLFQNGDIFTPTPEPDSAGIKGVTYCPQNLCQFKDASDFNQWIRNAQLVSKLSFKTIGLNDIKIGYYGTSGFIVFGENNPDHIGTSYLEPKTVFSMDNIIAMDTYPEGFSSNLGQSIDGAHNVWPSATLVIGEWGTIHATNSAQAVNQVNVSMSEATSRSAFLKGFNYWHLGIGGNESLLNNDFTPNQIYNAVKTFFKM